MKRFKRHKDYGFFDQDLRLSKLSQLCDPLEKLAQDVDFELFRNKLEEVLSVDSHGKGGRPPYDYVLMFKILILQRYYNLSDEQVEYQINDRMSFMCFLDLTIADDIPDSRTVWHFRERLVDLELIEELFALFLTELERLNLVVNEGKIVDASFIEVPKQRNSRNENKQIKEGKIPAGFLENPHKSTQKDVDARWTKKDNVSYFGYKNHVKIDAGSKLITNYLVTDASVHDSQVIEELLDEVKDKGENLYADSAYCGQPQEAIMQNKGVVSKICEKGYKNKPLTDEQEASNREKSRARSRVEHIFAFMENSMNEMYLYNVGKKYNTPGILDSLLSWNIFA